jgi:hypothetical protein
MCQRAIIPGTVEQLGEHGQQEVGLRPRVKRISDSLHQRQAAASRTWNYPQVATPSMVDMI